MRRCRNNLSVCWLRLMKHEILRTNNQVSEYFPKQVPTEEQFI